MAHPGLKRYTAEPVRNGHQTITDHQRGMVVASLYGLDPSNILAMLNGELACYPTEDAYLEARKAGENNRRRAVYAEADARDLREEKSKLREQVQQLLDENHTLREAAQLPTPPKPGTYWTLAELHKAVQELVASLLPAFTYIDVTVSDTVVPYPSVTVDIKPSAPRSPVSVALETRIMERVNERCYVPSSFLSSIFSVQSRDVSLPTEVREMLARVAKAFTV